jgi:hypothetical protein
LLFILVGLVAVLVGLAGYLIPAVRDVDELLPDHQAAGGEPEAPAEAPVVAEPAVPPP